MQIAAAQVMEARALCRCSCPEATTTALQALEARVDFVDPGLMARLSLEHRSRHGLIPPVLPRDSCHEILVRFKHLTTAQRRFQGVAGCRGFATPVDLA